VADDSEIWVSQTAEVYKTLQGEPERPRLVAFLDAATTARVGEVGLDQTLTELSEAIQRAATKY
jgi:hypothetical protein